MVVLVSDLGDDSSACICSIIESVDFICSDGPFALTKVTAQNSRTRMFLSLFRQTACCLRVLLYIIIFPK